MSFPWMESPISFSEDEGKRGEDNETTHFDCG